MEWHYQNPNPNPTPPHPTPPHPTPAHRGLKGVGKIANTVFNPKTEITRIAEKLKQVEKLRKEQRISQYNSSSALDMSALADHSAPDNSPIRKSKSRIQTSTDARSMLNTLLMQSKDEYTSEENTFLKDFYRIGKLSNAEIGWRPLQCYNGVDTFASVDSTSTISRSKLGKAESTILNVNPLEVLTVIQNAWADKNHVFRLWERKHSNTCEKYAKQYFVIKQVSFIPSPSPSPSPRAIEASCIARQQHHPLLN